MSFLRELLGPAEPLCDQRLAQLEAAAHQPGVDARLSAEIRQKGITAMRQLGLDTADTTGSELYHALLARVQADAAHLAHILAGVGLTGCLGPADFVGAYHS